MGDCEKSTMRIEIIVNTTRKSLVLTLQNDMTFEQVLKMACNKIRKQSIKNCSLICRGEKIENLMDVVSASAKDGNQLWLLVSEKEKYQGPTADTFAALSEAELKVSIVASEDVYIEQEAIDQIHTLVQSSDGNILQAVGMPDLHQGPTGVAILAKEPIPKIPGYDIGCGMSLFETNIPATISHDKVIRHMAKINIDTSEDIEDSYLGTLGGGNHFAELLRIDESVSLDASLTGIVHPEKVYLLVHSGSRGHGERVFQAYVHEHHDAYRYMDEHTALIAWAKRNRAVIATRFLQQFHQVQREYQEEDTSSSEGDAPTTSFLRQPLIDIAHNYIEPIAADRCTVLPDSSASSSSTYYLHRKGAAPAYANTLSLLPGSRGTASYILLGHGAPSQLYSLAHGAGRRLSRADARKKRSNGSSSSTGSEGMDLTNGGSIICKNQDLLYEEAPFAYKDVEAVVSCMQSYDMCSIGARLIPIATYKTATIG